jgi:3-phenylpropionate/trans-cinnamate dioxygenase ferredoxin reductase subunit
VRVPTLGAPTASQALGYALFRMLGKIVIVGAGQAAAQAVETLRRRGFHETITLVGEEPLCPYQRPPLSKKYLSGAMSPERLLIRPPHFYAEHAIDLRLGRRAVEIDRTAQRVRLDDGDTLAYEALLLATGSRPRGLQVPGSELKNIYFLRTIADVDRIRAGLTPGVSLVVVGGGYIGLEVAASSHELGVETTVLEMADRVMSRVTCETVSSFYAREHARHGVRIFCGARVRAFQGTPSNGVRSVACEDGSEHRADVVVVGVGVAPVDELASAAGLECANGIVVDEFCRTTDPNIYAAGDCTNHPSAHYARRLRLESVDNAFEQGTSAALNMLGIVTRHDKVPWFWSDQFDLKLIIVGVSQGADTELLRGDPLSRSFTMCYLRAGELIAVDTINSAKDQMAARKLIPARVRPNLDRLKDMSCALKDCL